MDKKTFVTSMLEKNLKYLTEKCSEFGIKMVASYHVDGVYYTNWTEDCGDDYKYNCAVTLFNNNFPGDDEEPVVETLPPVEEALEAVGEVLEQVAAEEVSSGE